MRWPKPLAFATLIVALGSAATRSQSREPAAVFYEGARLIFGDDRPALENGAFLVENGRIAAMGRTGAIAVSPAGASHVDLTGKTVMPAMINVHVHIGYEGYGSWGAQNYTAPNVLNHLQREAFYGVAATTSVGSSPTDASLQFQRDQQAGKYPPASRYLFMPGMAPPNGGPDAVLIKATSALHAVDEVSTAQEARDAVRRMAAKGIGHVKIWVDDRRGTYPKMTPEVYTAVLDEAHQHRMKVHSHVTTLADQKALVRAGVDVVVHTVQAEKLDDEYLALLGEKKPYWTSVIGLGDRTEVCEDGGFFTQTLPPPLVAKIRATMEVRPLEPSCGPPPATAAAREEMLASNIPRMIAAGARLVLGTDAGISAGYTFGSAEHHEIARWVQLGLTPAQAIVAATSRPAELLGLTELGALSIGKSADFLVLDANPLDDIRNTRRIAAVYLRGEKFDRDGQIAAWQRASR